ncbi:PD-(D/E)XK nuclease family protein [Desulfonatronovibrio hydrogenovorans]|uniref:PD-(D/E)XK nuclease family protein n=1 Tax=Desulfonatronovibrio hydrogenovorans TaxID=53245 RepID=UPI00048FC078|nr:PD-(D/E)XK nuclease family protein [Desulfonatronovibrio hydrogenovorans]
MNFQPAEKSEVFKILEAQGELVTSTRRLSRHLNMAFARYQQQKNQLVWETPTLLPLSSWQEKAFFSAQKDRSYPSLLTPEQEKTIWQEIIAESGHDLALSGYSEMAAAAGRAFDTMIRYRFSLEELETCLESEVRVFAGWARAFMNVCSQEKFLYRAGLSDFISRLWEKNRLEIPKQLVLAGFYEFDPALNDLLRVLSRQGTSLFVLKKKSAAPNIDKVAFNEFSQEAETAACWALNLILNDPGISIGILVPGLENYRNRLVRTFDRIFHPDQLTVPTEPENRVFNLSLGEPLSTRPLVRCGLLFLDFLVRDQWDIQELSVLLNSPFIFGGSDEFPARSALDTKIRQGGQPWRTPDLVLELASDQSGPWHCPELVRIFHQAQELVQDQDPFQSPARWAAVFSRLLKLAGWPDARALNSPEFQTVQAFNSQLTKLSGLEKVLQKISYSKALSKLTSLAHTEIFQPESGQVPVQILGLLEIPGLEFDHLWVMNMNADVLPAPSKPNPFLPVDLQRKNFTPGSSPARELELAQKLMDSILQSCPNITFSYSVKKDDQDLLESPFIKKFILIEPEKVDIRPALDVSGLFRQHSRLEEIIDDHGLTLRGHQLTGGTRAFQDQALCPFKGYAIHRLGALPVEEPLFALGPVDRGNLIHRALMLTWQEIYSLEELRELKELNTLEPLLDRVAEIAVHEFARNGHVLFTAEFMDIEVLRLKTHLKNWLDLELERKDFQILALEKNEEAVINGIRIKTRLDRMDKLDNGRPVIIDYKTGAAMEKIEAMWMQERIIEPQLPIYAQAAQTTPAAVVLAQINAGAMKLHGLVDNASPILENDSQARKHRLDQADLEQALATWQERLGLIAGELKDGLALVDPLPRPGDKTCRYCHLMPLCRINDQD